uniref:Uncharacterized protein n=1 Tax=Anguilla anguilla TaxID=7936 RepID=A0A0E9Q5P1_ANGAN
MIKASISALVEVHPVKCANNTLLTSERLARSFELH